MDALTDTPAADTPVMAHPDPKPEDPRAEALFGCHVRTHTTGYADGRDTVIVPRYAALPGCDVSLPRQRYVVLGWYSGSRNGRWQAVTHSNDFADALLAYETLAEHADERAWKALSPMPDGAGLVMRQSRGPVVLADNRHAVARALLENAAYRL